MKNPKLRLDELLVAKELVPTRSKALAMILAGWVKVNDCVVTKAGTKFSEDVIIELKEKLRYVSRGGLKLEEALRVFDLDPTDKIALDVGASTGGFTDCLLQHGAKKVWALDVGHNQLDYRMRTDERVVVLEKTHFRNFDIQTLTDTIEWVVMDVAFISACSLIPQIKNIFEHQNIQKGRVIILVKPQFELEPHLLGKGGIVKEESSRLMALDKVKTCLRDQGFINLAETPSPITGADGNVEFLVTAVYSLT